MNKTTRRAFLTTTGETLASAMLGGCSLAKLSRPAPQGAKASRPNFLIILADDLGWGDLSCYGAPDLLTPNIDRLVSQGMRFDNFYANCPVCSPTRAALLTGRYPELVGVPGVIRTHANNSWGYLDPNCELLPELLRPAGYTTALIGKWHLGLTPPNIPNERGFDFFHGFLGDMMDDYYTHRRHGYNYMRLNREVIDPKGHATDLFTRWACEYIRRQSAERPFFLYLAYNAPHGPIQPPNEWLERVLRREKTIDRRRAKLCALIEHLDDGIGRVLATLRECGLDRNTLVIFTSDNGGDLRAGANNGPWRDGKGKLYEGGIRVPAAARWPGRIEPASRTDRIALTMDIFPTVLEAAGVAVRHEIDGVSFLPTLLGQKQPQLERDLFFGRREGGRQFRGKTVEAIRRGPWKLLRPLPDRPLELYNLQRDPRERINLARAEPEKFNELKAALDAQIERYRAVPWKPPER